MRYFALTLFLCSLAFCAPPVVRLGDFLHSYSLGKRVVKISPPKSVPNVGATIQGFNFIGRVNVGYCEAGYGVNTSSGFVFTGNSFDDDGYGVVDFSYYIQGQTIDRIEFGFACEGVEMMDFENDTARMFVTCTMNAFNVYIATLGDNDDFTTSVSSLPVQTTTGDWVYNNQSSYQHLLSISLPSSNDTVSYFAVKTEFVGGDWGSCRIRDVDWDYMWGKVSCFLVFDLYTRANGGGGEGEGGGGSGEGGGGEGEGGGGSGEGGGDTTNITIIKDNTTIIKDNTESLKTKLDSTTSAVEDVNSTLQEIAEDLDEDLDDVKLKLDATTSAVGDVNGTLQEIAEDLDEDLDDVKLKLDATTSAIGEGNLKLDSISSAIGDLNDYLQSDMSGSTSVTSMASTPGYNGEGSGSSSGGGGEGDFGDSYASAIDSLKNSVGDLGQKLGFSSGALDGSGNYPSMRFDLPMIGEFSVDWNNAVTGSVFRRIATLTKLILTFSLVVSFAYAVMKVLHTV